MNECMNEYGRLPRQKLLWKCCALRLGLHLSANAKHSLSGIWNLQCNAGPYGFVLSKEESRVVFAGLPSPSPF